MFEKQIVIDGLQYSYWDRAYFEMLHNSGLSAVHVTLAYHELARETLSLFAKWNQYFLEHEDLIAPVRNASDILDAKSRNRVGIFFGAQNCSPIEDDIGLLSVMRQLGLLIMQLTYNNQSLLATGCYERVDAGITNFGKQAIEEMNRIGMIIDMSHSGEKSTLEAIEYSKRPICISHANPQRAQQALRNKSDAVIKALLESGGLLGFSLYPFHLPGGSCCTLEQFCQMIADIAEEFGVDGLAIGSDLCCNQSGSVLEWMRNGKWSKAMNYGEGSAEQSAWPSPIPWFCDENGMANIYRGLQDIGFNLREVNQIIGGNWLRFLQESL